MFYMEIVESIPLLFGLRNGSGLENELFFLQVQESIVRSGRFA